MKQEIKRLKDTEKITYLARGVCLDHIRSMKEHYAQNNYTSTLNIIIMEHKRLEQEENKRKNSLMSDVLKNIGLKG